MVNYDLQIEFLKKGLDGKLRLGENLIFNDWEWSYLGEPGEKHVFNFYNKKLRVQLGFFIDFDDEYLIALNRHRISEVKKKGNFGKCLDFLIDFFKNFINDLKQEKICIIFQIDLQNTEGGLEIISWLENRNYDQINENQWMRIY